MSLLVNSVPQELITAGKVWTKVKCTLQAHNGPYVCAEGGGGREVVANRSQALGNQEAIRNDTRHLGFL